MTNEEKLASFQKSTITAARLKSSKIIDDFESSLKKEFDEHKAKKEQQAKLYLKAETEALLRERNKILSSEQIHVRRDLTERHDELKNALFDEVREMLSHYMETPEYEKLLIKQIEKDMKFAHGQKITIYIDPSDAGRKETLEAATGAVLTVSEYTFIGGTRAVLAEQSILIDDSFSTKLDEAYEDFSFEGGQIHE